DPSVRVGFELGGPGAMWLSWRVGEEGGDDSLNRFQLSFQQVGTEGDFDLIMNYIGVDWDPGQVGFTDGAGSGFVFDGSGTAGGLLGDDNDNMPMCGPTSIACNMGFGGVNPSEPLAPGFYVFQFRNGVPINVDLQAVPLPAAVWLFLAGLAGLGHSARRRARQA
ncbi:MAG: VPLPA-CTERM sorting domain-containing protein, partial [Hyphococcus sp.]